VDVVFSHVLADDQIWAAVKSATAAGKKPKQTTEKENTYGHGEE
jgi:hypothetical protein